MSKTGKTTPPKDFESALAELEGLVERMESGQLPLEESLAAYRRGIELTSYCQQKLNAAEQQVKLLEDGRLKDFQAESSNDD
ncbi:exodeoxyribonuclease VII small subunit [Sulfuritortus calidifontis]|uniref:Exodeoxyribonuclease 7 small subunit n=1 Tax=Sulfuritortus calidifontis TaxID=1914471 RepID=A0A4R3JZ30_9PROT|nr:exodeoxyribonuclease VII small subunit [Sulfuritortus calidifontis]TCS74025.1 exodeoxyribonuclease VII small subunit [Sulfuritortus calidifontis]